jgi:geranylgeranyl reductase
MVDEFDIPAEIIDRKVTKMKMISPSNREVDVGYVFFFFFLPSFLSTLFRVRLRHLKGSRRSPPSLSTRTETEHTHKKNSRTLSETEYIGMCRREVMDDFLRKRAEGLGAQLVNGLLLRMEQPEGPQGPITIHYNDYAAGDGKVGKPSSMEVDMVRSFFCFFSNEFDLET